MNKMCDLKKTVQIHCGEQVDLGQSVVLEAETPTVECGILGW